MFIKILLDYEKDFSVSSLCYCIHRYSVCPCFAYYAVLHSKDISLFSALRSCISASRAFLRAAAKCGLTPTAYFRKYLDFYSYLDLSRLRSHFENYLAIVTGKRE